MSSIHRPTLKISSTETKRTPLIPRQQHGLHGRSFIGPLTTVSTIPASCQTCIGTSAGPPTTFSSCDAFVDGCARTGCLKPTSQYMWAVYSPGFFCPHAWTTAQAMAYNDTFDVDLKPGEVGAICCPSGFELQFMADDLYVCDRSVTAGSWTEYNCEGAKTVKTVVPRDISMPEDQTYLESELPGHQLCR
ncbi:hypothetical protein B0H66DRAFT_272103 [Apodospora peruviana]|uniref:Uncharacterized protein n=1 Tax=Apodospora peruviana TaxID=516989 RepID=A0AAE0M1R1_9PEZI|nr:hypothetical protein B0H66DRAFT_272103 [Apodospora peruviana]